MPETVNDLDQFYHDIFIAAIEGGITYWARIDSYRWSTGDQTTPDLKGYSARILDAEYDVSYTVDRAVISRGIRRIVQGKCTWGGREMHKAFIARMAGALAIKDAGNIDAGDADNIVQAGLFGDVRYG